MTTKGQTQRMVKAVYRTIWAVSISTYKVNGTAAAINGHEYAA